MVINNIFSILSPIFIGMAAAFVINHPTCRIYGLLIKISDSIAEEPHKSIFTCRTKSYPANHRQKRVWNISIAITYLLLISCIAGILWLIVPQISASIKLLISNGDLYREKFMLYYSALEKRDKFGILPLISSALKNISLSELIAGAYGKTLDFIGGTANIIIGVIISIYILIEKENLRLIVQKIAHHFLDDTKFEKTAQIYRNIYDVFSRFVSGQIIEAFILGILCFLGMALLGFDYAPLISMVIGVTALIPIAGAIIGTIPCALLLFLSEPISAVWFIIFIIILQQLENNFIYPKIVGKSMGLPPLPVLLAIVIGGKIGGIIGILIAVPTAAVIYGIGKEKLFN